MGPLPTSLGNVSVTINGNAVPLYSVSNVNGSEQINFQVPFDLTLHAGFIPHVGDPERKPMLDVLAQVGDLAQAAGVTAAFNLNLLQRINRELGGNFDLKKFTHRAFYDEERGRIEMHLVSREAQRVQIDAYEVAFAEGEVRDGDGRLIATASSTCLIFPLDEE